MSFRTRLLLANGLLVVLPLLVLGIVLHRSFTARLADAYRQRVATAMAAAEEGLLADRRELGERLAALAREADEDQALRLAVAGLPERAVYPDEFAERAARLTGLDLVWLLDRRGGVRGAAGLPPNSPPGDLLRALDRTRDGFGLLPPAGAAPDSAPVLVVRDSVRLGGRTLHLVGGRRLDEQRLADLVAGAGIDVTLIYPGGAVSTDPDLLVPARRAGRDRLADPWFALPRDRYWLRWETFPRRGATAAEPAPPPPLARAVLVLSHPRRDWQATERSLVTWLLAAVGVTATGALLAAILLSVWIVRPLRRLAAAAAGLDLPALAGEFPVDRRDEVGEAARALDRLRDRLRRQLRELREAERRAALGDLARQVNHDLRNGFVPLRNIFWHLLQVAREDPDRLPRVLLERQGTIEAGLGYLEELAGAYRRLGGRGGGRCDPAAVVAELAAQYGDELVVVAPDTPLSTIGLAAVDLRRVLENLVRNALESQQETRVAVPVELALASEDGDVVVTVRDHGPGMSDEQRRRATEMFYTTKPGGTGLGLAIVRRLVTDAGGEFSLSAAPGGGTLATLRLPPATEER